MTDSQLRYQQLQEDVRHNMAVERISSMQAKAATKQAEAAEVQASVKAQMLPYEQFLTEQQALHTQDQTKLYPLTKGAEIGIEAGKAIVKSLAGPLGALIDLFV